MKKSALTPFRLALWPCFGLCLSLPTVAQASGVTAGTLIQNTASATYDIGPGSGSVQSNTVTVRVDELLDVAVTGLTSTPTPIGVDAVALAYSVTNTGNGPEAFSLVANPVVGGNDFDAVVQTIVIDSNGNGQYDPGVDTTLAAGAPSPVMNADASITVFVLVTLPSGVSDGAESQVRLAASAITGTGTPGTVFSGQGEGGGDAVVGSSTASDDGLDSLIASLATVTLIKSATIVDPFGGSQPVPGAIVTFRIAAGVSGSGSANNLRVTDAIPAGTTYQAGSLTLDGVALSDAVDADPGEAAASGVAVQLGSVAGGSSRDVRFQVKIN